MKGTHFGKSRVARVRAAAALTGRIISRSYHVFGSGAASARLTLTGSPDRVPAIPGSARDEGHNGFIGWTSEEFSLPGCTLVDYKKGASPGATFRRRSMTWGELIALRGLS